MKWLRQLGLLLLPGLLLVSQQLVSEEYVAPGHAGSPVVMSSSVYADFAGILNSDDVLKMPFSSLGAAGTVFTLDANTRYWFKLSLTNRSTRALERRLVIPNPVIDVIDIYNQGTVVSRLGARRVSPSLDKAVLPSFELMLLPGETRELLVSAQSSKGVFVAFWQLSEDSYHGFAQRQLIIWGAISGVLAVFILYSLILWLINRSSVYAYFSLYLFAALLLTWKTSGLTSNLVSAAADIALLRYHGLASSLANAVILCFVAQFVAVNEGTSLIRKRLCEGMLAIIVLGVGSIFLSHQYQVLLSEIELAAILLVIIVLALKLGRDAGTWLRLFFASWLPVLGALVLLVVMYLVPSGPALYLSQVFAVSTIANAMVIWLALNLRTETIEKTHAYSLSHDLETRLPNLEMLQGKTGELIAAGQPFSLLLFRPQDFSDARASFGLDHANEYLRKIISQLNYQLEGMNNCVIEHHGKRQDFVCRINDQTFALLAMGRFELSMLEQYVCVINATFMEGVELADTHLVDQVELGVANYPLHADNGEGLLRCAMQALFTPKEYGQKWHIYNREDSLRSQRRLSLASELKHAIHREQFTLYFQPQIRLSDNRVFGAEVLLRWQHPELGLVPPDQFIPVAESAGIIFEITEWVMEQALRFQSKLLSSHPEHTISINISGRDLGNRNLPVLLLTLINELAIPPSSVVIELTESATVLNQRGAKGILDDFKSIGVKMAIDDFGTGYSSLAYVSQLGVDEIKIDKQFVIGIAHSPIDQTICRVTCDMAKSLGACVVAEGIESASDMAFLKTYGCDVGQGYHYGRPMPFSDYLVWLEEKHEFPTSSIEVFLRNP